MGFAVMIVDPSGRRLMLSGGEGRAPGWVAEMERSILSIVLSGPSGPGPGETAIMGFTTQILEGLGRCSVGSCCGFRTLNE